MWWLTKSVTRSGSDTMQTRSSSCAGAPRPAGQGHSSPPSRACSPSPMKSGSNCSECIPEIGSSFRLAPLLHLRAQTAVQKFFYARPEVDLRLEHAPAVAFFGIDDPLDVLVCPADRVAELSAMLDRYTHINPAICQQQRPAHLRCLFDGRRFLELAGVSNRITDQQRHAVVLRFLRGIAPVDGIHQ